MLETADIIARAASTAKHHDAAFSAALSPLPPASKRLTMTIPIGTAVLDLVTGEQGVVIDGKRENVVIPSATNAGA